MYNKKEVKAANKTNRGRGAVGKKAIVPRYVSNNYPKDTCILDFGAGKEALHSKTLRDDGFEQVTAYDFGDNFNDNHDPDALKWSYDVIMMSNVLNVQQSKEMLHETIKDVKKAMSYHTEVVANYPKSPRYIGFSDKELVDWLSAYFQSIERHGGILVMRLTD